MGGRIASTLTAAREWVGRRFSRDADWRLQVDLGSGRTDGDLDGLCERVRSALGEEIVLTHQASSVFAYATGVALLAVAREAIESDLRGARATADYKVSHWDRDRMLWLQTDPPLAIDDRLRAEGLDPSSQPARTDSLGRLMATQTVVCVVGKLIRSSFEQQMLALARSKELECEIVEHPHLLSVHVGFTVTGTRQDVAAFSRHLNRSARSTIRVDPGLVPFGSF